MGDAAPGLPDEGRLIPDQHANFAYSTVATAPSPATTGLSLVVQAGNGALYPPPPFNAIACPAGQAPKASNAEIVRVTNIAGDTCTIVRQQEGTSARSITVGDQFFAAITAKTLTDVEGAGAPVQFAAHSAAAQLGSAAAVAKVALNTKDYDSGGYYDVVNYRFKPGVAGYYQISFGVRAQATLAAGDEILLYLKDKNGAAVGTGLIEATAGTSGAAMAPSPVGGGLYYFDGATDYVELWGVCWASGGGQATQTFTGWMTGFLTGGIGSPSPGQGLSTMARAYRATTYSTAAGGAAGKVPLDTKTGWGYDPGGNFDTSNNRYVCPATGYYTVHGQVSLSMGATYGRVMIYKNGALASTGEAENSLAAESHDLVVADTIYCAAGDYLELWVLTGTSVSAWYADGNNNYLSVVQVGGTNLVGALSPTAQAAAYTAGAGQLVLMTGQYAVTLPSAPMAGSQVGISALTAPVPVNRGGTDTINLNGTASQTQITVPTGQVLVLTYLGGVWYGALQSVGSTAPLPACAWNKSTAQTPGGAAWTKVLIDTVAFDPGGNMDAQVSAGNHRYNVPAAGYYMVFGSVASVTQTTSYLEIASIYKNGAEAIRGNQVYTGGNSSNGRSQNVAGVIQCNAGDYLELFVYVNGTAQALELQAAPTENFLQVVPVGQFGSPSPGQGLSTAARMWRSAAYAPGNVIPFDTVSFDPGGNCNVAGIDGTATKGRYTCPATGYYQVDGQLSLNAPTSGQVYISEIWVNGVERSRGQRVTAWSTAVVDLVVSDVVYCQAGDYIQLYLYPGTGPALEVGGAFENYLSVVQVGGTNLVGALSPTAQTADYTAGAGQRVLMTGAHTVTLPSAPMAGSTVEVVALTGTVTINRAGTDTINVRGTSGQTTCSIGAGGNLTLQYLGGVWYVVDGSQTLTPSPWIAPGLLNSWVNTGGGQATVGYYKDPNGIVHLRGRIKSGTNGTVLFVLPAGYRPAMHDTFPAAVYINPAAGGAFIYIDVSNGNVWVYVSGAFQDVGLGGISFLAES